MERLYLLGYTHDLSGVVFTERKGGKTATFWLPVDDALVEALEKLEAARRDAEEPEESADVPTQDAPKPRVHLPPVGRSQATGRMPASEIQQLLREGRTVATVAKAARTSRAWVERLAEPVQVEREGVIRLAQRATMSRARLGPSGLPVGQAVRNNLEDRRATIETLESLDDGWDARKLRSGPWRVRLRFTHRGRRMVAEWSFTKSTRQVTSHNRLAVDLGWWPPPEPEVDEPDEAGDAEAEADEEPEKKPKEEEAAASNARKRRGSGRRSTGKRSRRKR